MSWYSIFDELGNKIGEIREDPPADGSGCLISLIGIVIGLCICAMPFACWYIVLGEIMSGDLPAMIIVGSMIFTTLLHTRRIIKNGMNTFLGTWVALTVSSAVVSGIVGILCELVTDELTDASIGVFIDTTLLAVIPALVGAIIIAVKER